MAKQSQVSAAGVKSGHIRVTEEKIAVLPDYLRFEKGIYIAFIKSGEVDGDTGDIHPQTSECSLKAPQQPELKQLPGLSAGK